MLKGEHEVDIVEYYVLLNTRRHFSSKFSISSHEVEILIQIYKLCQNENLSEKFSLRTNLMSFYHILNTCNDIKEMYTSKEFIIRSPHSLFTFCKSLARKTN